MMCVVSFYKVFFLERGKEGVDNTCLSPLPLLGINDHFPKKNLYFIGFKFYLVNSQSGYKCQCFTF